MLRRLADHRAGSGMGRPRLWHEQTVARLPAGAMKRIKAALRPGESQMQFIARAIMAAVERREREAERKRDKN
jgi:hypothetical protein